MASVRERIEMMVGSFVEEYDGEGIAIYGCTVFAKQIYLLLRENSIPVDAFVDNDVRKAGDKYLGVDIFLPEQYLLPFDAHKRIIVCSIHEEEMLHSLHKMGYGGENILHISSELEITLDSMGYAEEKMNLVRAGMRCYQRLQSEYGSSAAILVAPEASGDVFLSCAYLQPWCRLYGISNYVLVGVNPNIVDIVELYGFHGRARRVSKEERESLLAAYMFMGEQLHIKPLTGWELRIRNSYVANPQSPFLFKEAFKYETYRLGKEAEPEYPRRIRQPIRDEFRGIEKGKTVIIAPYAYSSPAPMTGTEIWEEIAGILCRKGYRVYTVGYGEKEPPIKDTLRIQFSYREACDVLEYAGGFIAARSGLCDIVHMAECRQLVIYGKNIRNAYLTEFFSLKKNYPDFKGEEIIFDDYTAQDFVKCVTGCF